MAGGSLHCPSVSVGSFGLQHEPCERAACSWWSDHHCSAAETIPIGRLTKKLRCELAPRCRWMAQAKDGLCPPMRLGEVCEHQGGTFNTFMLELT